MSTDSVCGFEEENLFFNESQPFKPYKDYGKSKLLAEKVLKEYNSKKLLNTTILRGFWFFGPNMPIRNKKFFKSFLWKYQILFGDGKNYRSITHLDDIYSALICASKSNLSIGKTYWIASLKKTTTVIEIYKIISRALNTKLQIIYIPKFLCEFISLLDRVYSSLTSKINPTLLAAGKFHKNIAIDNKKIKQLNKNFDWETDINIDQIKEEIRSQIFKN